MSENIPEIRFPEFNDGWKEKKLSEIANIEGGGTPSTEIEDYWNGNINWFTPSEVGKTKYLDSSNRKISEKGFRNSSAKLLPSETILISSRATIGEISILKCEGTTNQGFQSLIVKNEYDNEFIYYLGSKLKKEMLRKASGSTFLEISKKEIGKINLNVPLIVEQKKIASFLSKLDEKIEKLEEKQQLWETYKKGIMQQIFNQKIRFKDENGEDYLDWEEKKLGDISKIKTGSKDLKDNVNEGKYPFFVRSNIIERINTYSFDGEAILIPGDGVNVGKIYHYINGKFDYHQRVYKISDFSDKSCGKYIYYYMMENFLKQALKNSLKASVDSLRLPTIKEMKVNLPSLPEQTKIVKFLSSIDEVIECVNKELELNKEFKKGLLQQMFC